MATVIFGDFEWEERKGAANLAKHGVSFEEAITALADPHAVTAPDLEFPDRWITIGRSMLLRVLFVVHTETISSGRIRIISSARKASASQRRKYEES